MSHLVSNFISEVEEDVGFLSEADVDQEDPDEMEQDTESSVEEIEGPPAPQVIVEDSLASHDDNQDVNFNDSVERGGTVRDELDGPCESHAPQSQPQSLGREHLLHEEQYL